MPTSLKVEKMLFTFGNEWVVFQYDDTDFYKKEAIKLQGEIGNKSHSTKAVDLIGLHQESGLLLLEAKDFRGHRIENKARIETREVAIEVAVKVRDTIAALVGAARKPVTEFPSKQLADALRHGKRIDVVLWLDDDTYREPEQAKVSLSILTGLLKKKLAWLNVQTFVLSSAVQNQIRHLTVTNLPGAGQGNP